MTINRRRFLAAMAAIPAAAHEAQARQDIMSGFDPPFSFSSGGMARDVYKIGAGPAILFLHEIPGLMPEDIALARELSEKYAVYLPLFFGKPGQGDSWFLGRFLRVALRTPCWGSEFNCVSATSLGTVVPWLAALALEIDSKSGGKGLAVIGNCLTGSLPLTLMANDAVKAKIKCAVLSQPALPLGVWPFPEQLTTAGKRALGVTDAVLTKAGSSGIPTLAFHFANDSFVPEDRLTALADKFPKGKPELFQYHKVTPDLACDNSSGRMVHHHSVLTVDNCGDNSPNGGMARTQLYNFLAANLHP